MKMNDAVSRLRASLCLLTLQLVLLSCPNPMTNVMVTNIKDKIAPEVVITSPAEGSYCANIVEIVGKVTDAATQAGDDGVIRSLSYTVLGSAVTGSIDFAADGSFSFQFSTVTLGSAFTLSITAIDWNGNQFDVLYPLRREGENGIPSFAARPGNKSVTLTWDPVPHTASYTLYYTTNGTLPSENIGQKKFDVTSPCELADLANGNMHVFRLKAEPEETWPESVSDYVKAIPLSELTLTPRVTGEFRKIRIEWAPIPATREFEVWRSTERYGTYDNLTGPIESTSYLDMDVMDGGWYWYKVIPTLAGSTLSFSSGAQTDPFCIHHPLLLGTSPSTNARGVAIDGSYAYVADWTSGLRLVDISHPASPSLAGLYPTNASGVAVSGSYAYVANPNVGLLVIDVSNPGSPTLEGTFPITGVTDVVISGSYAYAVDPASGLYVVDISDPASPALEGTRATTATGVAISGSYAYVANPNVGLEVIDITNPEAPTLTGTWVPESPEYPEAQCVAVSGSYAYVGDGEYGLKVIDISNPAFPTLVKTCPDTEYISRVWVSGPYAYVTFSGGVYVVAISFPDSPIVVATWLTIDASAVAVSGSCAYVADGIGGLRILDISNPASASIVGACPTTEATGVSVNGPYAYVADGSSGLQIIDVSNAASPALVSTYPTTDASGVAVSGPYAYVADGTTGLQIIDVSNAASPAFVSTCPTTDASGVAVSGDYVYLADGSEGLRIIDISDPASPALVGTYRTNEALGVAVYGSYAYVADGYGGLRIIDVSDPHDPITIAAYPTASKTYGVVVCGSYAYLADGSSLQVVDISDPGHPQYKDYWGPGGEDSAQGVAVIGSYAYVVFLSGLRVIDITNPDELSLVSTCLTPHGYGVAVSGSHAYIADQYNGLQVVDLLP